MTNVLSRLCTTAVVLAAVGTSACGQDSNRGAGLKAGDPAPPLSVGKWIKGEPVTMFEPGKVYMMEFWATWCEPCIQAMPDVTKLQAKYADDGFVVIAMNIWETDPRDGEDMVKRMGDKMQFRVASDQVHPGQEAETGKMSEAWMKAAGRKKLPTTMLVDRQGRVAWIGSPYEVEKPLARIMAGTFDIAAEAARQKKVESLDQRYGDAIVEKDYDRALAVVEEALAQEPEIADDFRPVKLAVLMKKKDYPAANAMAQELWNTSGDDQRVLLAIAAQLLLAEDAKRVDLDLALRATEKAATMGGDLVVRAKVLAARVHAAKGDFGQAAALQGEAIDAAPEESRAILKLDLEDYKEKANKAKAK